jgi:hypothetical protein
MVPRRRPGGAPPPQWAANLRFDRPPRGRRGRLSCEVPGLAIAAAIPPRREPQTRFLRCEGRPYCGHVRVLLPGNVSSRGCRSRSAAPVPGSPTPARPSPNRHVSSPKPGADGQPASIRARRGSAPCLPRSPAKNAGRSLHRFPGRPDGDRASLAIRRRHRTGRPRRSHRTSGRLMDIGAGLSAMAANAFWPRGATPRPHPHPAALVADGRAVGEGTFPACVGSSGFGTDLPRTERNREATAITADDVRGMGNARRRRGSRAVARGRVRRQAPGSAR